MNTRIIGPGLLLLFLRIFSNKVYNGNFFIIFIEKNGNGI